MGIIDNLLHRTVRATEVSNS